MQSKTDVSASAAGKKDEPKNERPLTELSTARERLQEFFDALNPLTYGPNAPAPRIATPADIREFRALPDLTDAERGKINDIEQRMLIAEGQKRMRGEAISAEVEERVMALLAGLQMYPPPLKTDTPAATSEEGGIGEVSGGTGGGMGDDRGQRKQEQPDQKRKEGGDAQP